MFINGVLINKQDKLSFDNFVCPGPLRLANDGNSHQLKGVVY